MPIQTQFYWVIPICGFCVFFTSPSILAFWILKILPHSKSNQPLYSGPRLTIVETLAVGSLDLAPSKWVFYAIFGLRVIGVWPEFFDLRACVCKVGCRGGMLEDWVQHLDFLIARLDYIHFYRDNMFYCYFFFFF